MKTLVALCCAVALMIAATVAAVETQHPDSQGQSAIEDIHHDLQQAMDAGAEVSLLVHGVSHSGLPTSLSRHAVTLQSNDGRLRLVMRLDRIDGLRLVNTVEEAAAAREALDAAQTRANLANWATAGIKGTITLDGMPLDGVEVRFYPQGEDQPLRTTTNEEGRYSLFVKRDADELGQMRVRIYRPKLVEGPPGLPARYGRASQLVADIKAGENTFDFALTSN